MGRTQREKARAKRAAFIAPTTPTSITTTPTRPPKLPTFSTTPTTTSSPPSSTSSSSPHHVDLLRLAFLEWLLPLKRLTSPHVLWDRFMADWSAIPSHELPVQSGRPATLFSHVRALRNSNNMGALRKEVREGRAKLARGAGEDAGGLRPHQTLLQWYLDGGEGSSEQVAAELPVDSDGTAVQTGDDASAEAGQKSKRRRTDAVDGESEENATLSKRQRSAQSSEKTLASSITANSNMWDALADG